VKTIDIQFKTKAVYEPNALMAPYRSNNYKNGFTNASTLNKEELLEKYLKEFRVEQCPLFLQHKCQQHRPFTCFHWHFQNQRRRRPIRRRDGTFNYSADVYCSKYDETTGLCPDGDECPYLHRTAGDTERRYHLKYYKTGMCVHDTDNRGFCVKNGPHCAFAHGANDLRPAVYDIRELQAIENGETDPLIGPNSLDKERSLLNDDPKWLDTTYVLANYKTEPCKKPPRLCRQGYACPQYHNNKDKRRSPKKYKYRSTPCPNVKSGDEWGDPVSCDAGDACQYCHTRTEQQFHPEIYKSTKCNDIQNTSYCPRGAFCAFAHVEQETVSLESPPPENGGHNLSEIISTVLPGQHPEAAEDTKIFAQRAPGSQLRNGSITPPFEENGVASPIDGQKFNVGGGGGSPASSSLGTSIDSAMVTATNTFVAKNRFLSGDHVNANNQSALLRRQLFAIENDPTISAVEKAQKRASLLLEVTAVTTSTNSVVTTFSNGTLFPSLGSERMDSVGSTLDQSINDLSLDPYESKSRKSSGFSSNASDVITANGKSRQYSGYEMDNKSRNCSGNSISAGLVSSGIFNSAAATAQNTQNNGGNTAPVMIPGSVVSNISPKGGSPLMQSTLTNGIINEQSNNTGDNNLMRTGNQLGLFDLTSNSSGTSANVVPPPTTSNSAAAVEVGRLKDELIQNRARLTSFEENIQQARTACEVYKREATLANRKADLAYKEKDAAMLKLAQMQKELDSLSGGPHLHVIRRVQDLKSTPIGVLKTIEWQLRKDLQEVEKVMRAHQQLESPQWLTGGGGNNRLFDFPTQTSGNDWASNLGILSTQHPIYGSLAQQ